MPENRLLTMASADGANVATDDEYASLAARLLGFQGGLTRSRHLNKVLRQGAFGSAALGEIVTRYGLIDADDDGDAEGFATRLRAAFAAMLSGVYYAPDTSATVNAIVIATDPAPAGPHGGYVRIFIRIGNTNTGPVTIARNAQGQRPATRKDGTALQSGDLVQGQIYAFNFDPVLGQFALDGLGSSEVPRIAANYTLYVRPNGSDAGGRNDGSVNDDARAFRTPAAAINYGLSRFSLSGGNLTIKLGVPGSYPAPGGIPQTVGTLLIVGDPGNIAGYVLFGPNPVFAQGTVVLNGLTIQNTSTSNATVSASASGFVTCVNVAVTSTQTGLAHFGAGNTGIIAISTGCSVLSSMANLFSAVTSGNVQINGNVALGNSLTFASGTALARSCGTIGVAPGVNFTGPGASGPRYLVLSNAAIEVNGGGANLFPGSAPGTNDGTGFYG